MINYLFGLIFAYSYFYASWKANFLGEMNTVLYVYLPSQFIGYFVWKENLRQEGGGQVVQAKKTVAQRLGIAAGFAGRQHVSVCPSPARGGRQLHQFGRLDHHDYRGRPAAHDSALPRAMDFMDCLKHPFHRVVGGEPVHVSDVRRVSAQFGVRIL